MTELARTAYRDYGANWIINGDTDEFWWLGAGNIRLILSEVSADYGVVRAPRHNFVYSPDEDGFMETMTVRHVRSTNYLGAPLPDKVCHRAGPDVIVADGSHMLQAPAWPVWPETPLEVLHFPMRTYA